MHHDVDPIEMKTQALSEVARKARGLQACREVTEQALGAVQEAVEAKRLDEARQLVELAVSTARKSKNRTLIQQALFAQKKLAALGKQGGTPR